MKTCNKQKHFYPYAINIIYTLFEEKQLLILKLTLFHNWLLQILGIEYHP